MPVLGKAVRFALVAAFFAAAGCSRERPLKVGIAVPSYAHAVLWLAQDGGFFARQGLQAEVYTLKGSADALKLLISGDMDFVLAGGDAVVKSGLAGGDAVAVSGLVNTYYHRLAARPPARETRDLRGRAIGLPFLGGPQDMTARAALKRAGLAYGSDVRIRNMGAEYARLAAVKDGLVDAVTTDAPPSVLAALGLRVVADAPSWGEPFPYMAAVARRERLARKPETALKFLRALCEAMAFYRDHEGESLALLVKRLPQEPGSRASASELYRANGPSRFAFPPRPDPRGYAAVLSFLEDPAAKARRPEEFIETRFLDALEREGSCR